MSMSGASVLTRLYARQTLSARVYHHSLRSIAGSSFFSKNTAFQSRHPHLSGKSKDTAATNHQQSHPFFTFISQFQKGVMLTFGAYPNVKEPGIRLYIPTIQSLYRVDLRTRIFELPDQQIITRDNVSASVNAVIFFHIFDAYNSCFKVDNANEGVIQMGQTELRDLLCQKSFNEILESRGEISDTIAKNMQPKCDVWGVKIEHFQLKNIDLTQDNMIRAMAKEAEATRERTAAMIRADGEFEAAKKLTQASRVLRSAPVAIDLRQLQTLERLSKESNQTTVIVPSEVFNHTDSLLGAGIGAALAQKRVNFEDDDIDSKFV